MALNIKDAETDRLARELASETHESITIATRTALEERLARIRRARRPSPAEDELLRIVERGRARATVDDRGADELVGYDEHGLPR